MALETFVDSNFQMAAQSLASTWPTGGFVGSSSSDNLPPKDDHYQAVVASLLNASSGNLPNTASMIAHMNLDRVSGEMNLTALNNSTNGLSGRPSSLVTNSKPALSKGPHLHRNSVSNTDSYLELPTSPASFSSRNLSSSSSVLDGSSIAQHTSYLDTNCVQVHKRKHQQKVAEMHKNSLLNGTKQDNRMPTQMHKKPRLDIQQEAIMHQHILQQLLQNSDSAQLRGHVPQLQALFQQHQFQNQKWQKILQSIAQYQGVDMQQQQQQQQMRQHLQQQALHQVPAMHPSNEGICSRRLMQQIYHLRQRPADNGISYWRKFIAEYYAPCARRRWCFSLYDKVGHHAFSMIPQTAMDAWQCNICGCESGRGFEVTSELLPRLNKMTFDSVMDELLFLDLPHERRFPSGLMMLEYEKAVQESVYEKLRVVREGHLRIIYTHDLKILSWEFCSRHHEELLPRTFLASQVNQLVHAARMHKSTDGGSVSVVVAPEDLQANCDTFLVAGSQLARTLDLQLVDDFGFAKRYTRCLQIAEIVNIMKDLMTFSRNNNMGPIESLKNYSQEITTMKLRKEGLEEKEGVGSAQGLPTDKDKVIAASTAPGSNVNESLVMTNGVHLTSSEQGALVLPDYYHKLLRQNSLTYDVGEVKQQSYSPYVSNQGAPFKPYKGPKTSSSGLIQNSRMDGLSSSHSLEGSQNKPDQAIQKILQEMVNNSRKVNGTAGDRVIREVGKSTVVDLPTRGKEIDIVRNVLSSGNVAAVGVGAVPRNALGGTAGRISSSGTVFNRESSEFCVNNSYMKKREPDVLEKLHLPEGLLNMIHGCHQNGDYSGNSDDMCYGWKA
ncbi:probable transcriptional regulator SLK3 [Corylus avellana]|uniref:probable transcriptional regulator SLK3 n=1 Tax=Corylus avellana TaxID=13451 RepID=UPI00286B81D3|nr:probable transcriptional regulator SLK3 [Corylus avellana]XP_059443276.1 probable transcriptional regulator SLK3 [Corylus avellana]XP_059443277.1 probable transcriptional regulator SLK3 [Corylus avellana]